MAKAKKKRYQPGPVEARERRKKGIVHVEGDKGAYNEQLRTDKGINALINKERRIDNIYKNFKDKYSNEPYNEEFKNIDIKDYMPGSFIGRHVSPWLISATDDGMVNPRSIFRVVRDYQPTVTYMSNADNSNVVVRERKEYPKLGDYFEQYNNQPILKDFFLDNQDFINAIDDDNVTIDLDASSDPSDVFTELLKSDEANSALAKAKDWVTGAGITPASFYATSPLDEGYNGILDEWFSNPQADRLDNIYNEVNGAMSIDDLFFPEKAQEEAKKRHDVYDFFKLPEDERNKLLKKELFERKKAYWDNLREQEKMLWEKVFQPKDTGELPTRIEKGLTDEGFPGQVIYDFIHRHMNDGNDYTQSIDRSIAGELSAEQLEGYPLYGSRGMKSKWLHSKFPDMLEKWQDPEYRKHPHKRAYQQGGIIKKTEVNDKDEDGKPENVTETAIIEEKQPIKKELSEFDKNKNIAKARNKDAYVSGATDTGKKRFTQLKKKQDSTTKNIVNAINRKY